jgi:membrane fusion protein (multidrug efflux system)
MATIGLPKQEAPTIFGNRFVAFRKSMSTPSVVRAVNDETAEPPKRPLSRRAVGIGIAAFLAVCAAAYVIVTWGDESTDDAQVDADVVSVPAQVAAVVTELHFADNQDVKAGQLLVQLDDAMAKSKLAQYEAAFESSSAMADAADADEKVAEANAYGNQAAAKAGVVGASASAASSAEQIREGEAAIEAAQAESERTQAEMTRAEALWKTNAIAKSSFDTARAEYDAARANLQRAKAHLATLKADQAEAVSKISEAQANFKKADNVPIFLAQARAKARNAHAQADMAKAQRDMAKLELDHTRILAPQDGRISRRTVSVGQMVQAGQGVAQLVPSAHIWVTANFKETQIARMKVGQPVDIDIDAFGGDVHGEVESFSAATGSRFALLPPDNASGNYTKVVQRLPVRIRLKDVDPESLRPGLSVVATVHTK